MSTQNNHPNNHIHPLPRRCRTKPACAACHSRRQKCAPDCILAPYFPHNRQQQFQNVRKLFGVNFIIKTINDHSDQEEKDDAMAGIIYEADARARDPAGGCSRILIELDQHIREAESELEFVKQLVALCKRIGLQKQLKPDDLDHHDDQMVR
nr:LOB domain-containing protein 22-like [Tanacetum cinerariifolium]